MSNDKLFCISGSYMSHCGSCGWNESMEMKHVLDLCYLTIYTTCFNSNRFTYSIKMKRANLQNRFAPFEKMISQIF
jgi:hypothetical protein